MEIRKYQKSDWEAVWPIIAAVFRAGETYVFSPDISEQEAHAIWIEVPQETYVMVDERDKIIGTYYIKPNQPGLGAHVCNCGYIVSEHARGKGAATAMCQHSQDIAVSLGFRAMQYNLVVTTNKRAIRVWTRQGFDILAVLSNAFKSKSVGYVDALIMYKELVDKELTNKELAAEAGINDSDSNEFESKALDSKVPNCY